MKRSPGPAARRAFRTGTVVAALAWLSGVAVFYWMGEFGPIAVGFALLVGFPVYLVCVASVLSVWLGYDKDMTDLRPVYRSKESEEPRDRRR